MDKWFDEQVMKLDVSNFILNPLAASANLCKPVHVK
jgi:hypothetical protein